MTYVFGGVMTSTSDAQALNNVLDDILTVPSSRIVTQVSSDDKRYNPCTICVVSPAYHGDLPIVYVSTRDAFTGRESKGLVTSLFYDLIDAWSERVTLVLTSYIANVTEDNYRTYKLRKVGVL